MELKTISKYSETLNNFCQFNDHFFEIKLYFNRKEKLLKSETK